jgi:hypothetical protein
MNATDRMAKRPEASNAAHDNLSHRDDVRMGSERSFGFVIAAALGVIAVVRLWHGAEAWYLLVAAAAFAGLALVVPRALRPLNIVWFRLGLVLHAVVTPVMLALMFYATITPIGWLMRAFGKRPLALEFDPEAKSYWIHRTPPGPAPDSLTNQF